MHGALGLLILLVLVGCAGPVSTASPGSGPSLSPEFRHGVQGLIADLADSGADASITDSFDGSPLAVEALNVCVGGHSVKVYSYGTEAERLAVAARIDPDDPSNVGTAIVEWVGTPRFWQRDRIIVLYTGRDEATVELLTDVMGDPFAHGQDGPELIPSTC